MNIQIELENNETVNFDIKNNNIAKVIKNNVKPKSGKIILEISKVEDVYRYKIGYKDNKLSNIPINKDEEKFGNSKFNDNAVDQDNKIGTIVLLLESPHQFEYDKYNNPIAPAQGTTGDNIDKNIINVIAEIIVVHGSVLSEGDYRIIICNPIQYQTSLFMYHNQKLKDEYATLRNQVWRKLWENENVKEDFKKRMDLYKPCLIINACTYALQEKVTNYLINNKYSNIYTTYHPSYWNGFNIKKQ